MIIPATSLPIYSLLIQHQWGYETGQISPSLWRYECPRWFHDWMGQHSMEDHLGLRPLIHGLVRTEFMWQSWDIDGIVGFKSWLYPDSSFALLIYLEGFHAHLWWAMFLVSSLISLPNAAHVPVLIETITKSTAEHVNAAVPEIKKMSITITIK